jgi:hypothetical protein
MKRLQGDRPGSGFPAGDHVHLALTCPANHLIARIGQNLAGDDPWIVWPAGSSRGKSNERFVATRTWVEWIGTDIADDPVQSARATTFRCLTCGTEDRYRVSRIRAVLDYLRDRGKPVALRLTSAQFNSVFRRLASQ